MMLRMAFISIVKFFRSRVTYMASACRCINHMHPCMKYKTRWICRNVGIFSLSELRLSISQLKLIKYKK